MYCKRCTSCCKEETIVSESGVNISKSATEYSFLIQDFSGSFSLNVTDNFNFNTSGIVIVKPISKTVEQGVERLKNYLSNNPLKTISITGLYVKDEQNTSAFPNLGIARANAIKSYFVTKGIFFSANRCVWGVI
ncbi:hypothetical protein FNB79_03355 [Formosa sediminum]|uniref:OmpA family protein n=1 Tax=Formosa sediminum TaxID=2594004 RepID=A0A516GNH0_9FLAO|nr:hypothetical protein [Formosa sediminum]QDO93049.1 hypothetical protein FNB79_03355 [Formosa sediminum]